MLTLTLSVGNYNHRHKFKEYVTNLVKEEFDLLGEVGIFNYCILTISMNLGFKLRAY